MKVSCDGSNRLSFRLEGGEGKVNIDKHFKFSKKNKGVFSFAKFTLFYYFSKVSLRRYFSLPLYFYKVDPFDQ